METLLAIVENDKVINVIVVEHDDENTINALGGRLLPEGSEVGIGWDCDKDNNFTAPVLPEPVAHAPSEVEVLKQALITKGILTEQELQSAKSNLKML